MKICCEKCHQDISPECNKAIENYTVGKVICPKCHYEQKRYISEADLLLYFGINEIAYILLSLLMIFIFNRIGINAVSIVIIFLVLIAGYFASKELSSRIYEKAYFKADIKNIVFEEDAKAVQRNISWQFMLFFAITITFITTNEGKLFFGIAMPVAALLTFVKLYFQLKFEHNKGSHK